MIKIAEEFKVKISAELDTSEAEAKMNALKSSLKGIGNENKIRLTMDTSNVTSQLNSIRQQIQSLSNIRISLNGGVGGSGASNSVKSLSKTYREMLSMANQISSMEIKIGSLKSAGGNSNQIAELESQLKSLQSTYAEINQSFANSNGFMSGQFDVGDFDKLQATLDKSKTKLAELDAKMADAKNKKASDIIGKFDNNVAKDIEKVNASYDKLKTKTTEVKKAMDEFKSAQNNMDLAKQSNDVDKITDAYEKYNDALEKVKRTNKEALDAENLQQSRVDLSQKMDKWLRDNSAATSQFGDKIKELQDRLKSCDATQLKGINSEFKTLINDAELAGVATQSFGDRFTTQLSKLGTYFSAAMLITKGVSAFKDMYEQVHQVDTAMTELYRVTDLSQTQYASLYDDMVGNAKQYGASLDGIITSTASWVRLGFDAKDANELAGLTSMYQHVTDLDEKTAVNNLVTAYKGFEKQLLESTGGDKVAAIEKIEDIYDKLGRHNCPRIQ